MADRPSPIRREFFGGGADDPLGLFHEFGGRAAGERPRAETRMIRNAERKAFDVLGLDADASAQESRPGSRHW